ncbi:hypothetical protein RUND412_009928 [Rhizina undulata]
MEEIQTPSIANTDNCASHGLNEDSQNSMSSIECPESQREPLSPTESQKPADLVAATAAPASLEGTIAPGPCEHVPPKVEFQVVIPASNNSKLAEHKLPQRKSPPANVGRELIYQGVVFDVIKPEEVDVSFPVFGSNVSAEKKSKGRNGKRSESTRELEDKVWVQRQRVHLREHLLTPPPDKSNIEMITFEDGLTFPKLPSWLHPFRELQDDGSPGIFLVRPSKDDYEGRFREILDHLRPYGLRMGAVKIKVPKECLRELPSSPPPQQEKTPSFPTPEHLQDAPGTPPKTTPPFTDSEVLIMKQRLPLHSRSKNSSAPIYHVLSSRKSSHPVSTLEPLCAALEEPTPESSALFIEAEKNDLSKSTQSIPLSGHRHLFETAMLYRTRSSWAAIRDGDKGPVTEYSTDNESSPDLRRVLGINDPCLTEIKGNVILNTKDMVPGIHTPYLYIGTAYSMFALHAEDFYAYSLNYHHKGADKCWRIISPRNHDILEDWLWSQLLETYSVRKKVARCSQFIRHQSVYLPVETLELLEIDSWMSRQRQGELLVTWPLAYHQGWNEGGNVNEACGYGDEAWRSGVVEGGEGAYRVCGECGGEGVRLEFVPSGDGDTDVDVIMGQAERNEFEYEDEEEDVVVLVGMKIPGT